MNVFEILISVLFFTAVVGTIASSVASPNENITGGALVLFGLITLIIVAGFVVYLARKMGVMKGR